MKITRRGFITAAGATITAGVIARGTFGQTRKSAGLFPLPAEAANDPIGRLSRDHFAPFVGTEFRGQSESGPAYFTLIAADAPVYRTNARRGYRGEGYSLVFQSGTGLADGTYSFDHSTLGQFSLFISGFGLAGTKYQAIVNRINQR